MRLFATLIIGMSLFGTVACSEPVQAIEGESAKGTMLPKSSSAAPPPGSFQQIVNPDSLGVNQAYLEVLIGQPAKFTDVDVFGITRNVYERDGCSLTTGVLDDKVVSVGLYLRPGICDIDVSDLLGRHSPVLASNTTYRDWSTRGTLHFTDFQIPSCMACGEGFPQALIDGTSASGSFDIGLSGWDSLAKADQWLGAIGASNIDEDTLPFTGRDCPLRQFDALGYATMADTPVEGIEFGRVGAVQPACSARPVQQYRNGGYLLGPDNISS